jgi:hypothetical protein
MTLDEVKRSAPRVMYFMETQCIVGTPDDCELVILYGAGGIGSVNGRKVLATRRSSAADYANGQQGKWIDAPSNSE